MKKLILLTALLLALAHFPDAQAQSIVGNQVDNGPSLPATCTTKQIFKLTAVSGGNNPGLYECDSVNTWTAAGSGATGGISSVSGTAGQVSVSPTTGAVVVGLPATITEALTFSNGATFPSALNFTALGAPAALTAGTPTAGGSCTAGTHSWKVTFINALGETTPSATSAVQTCVTSTGQTVPLSAIPLGPPGTTGRNIYATKTGNTGSYFLVAASPVIADNTTTTYSFTIADGSFTATTAPVSDTTAGVALQVAGVNQVDINSSGVPTKVSGVTTAGTGVEVVQCAVSSKSETGADTNVLTCTPAAAAGIYMLRVTLDVNTVSSATGFGFTATWKNSEGASMAPTNLSLFQMGVAAPALTYTATASTTYYADVPLAVDNSGTNIVVKTTFSGTSIAYLASATITRLF